MLFSLARKFHYVTIYFNVYFPMSILLFTSVVYLPPFFITVMRYSSLVLLHLTLSATEVFRSHAFGKSRMSVTTSSHLLLAPAFDLFLRVLFCVIQVAYLNCSTSFKLCSFCFGCLNIAFAFLIRDARQK